MLGTAVDLALDARLAQAALQFLGYLGDELLALLALHAHQPHQLVVALGIEVAKRQVLQFPLDGVHAQPVGQRGVDIQRLPCDGHLPLRPLPLERAHVVQPVRQLDQNHPDVLGHGQEHLAKGLGLGLLPVGEVELRELGHAVHQQGHLVAEHRAHVVQRAALHVLHAVVQKARRDGGRVQHQIRQYDRHRAGVAKIGIARFPHLVGVGLFRESVGPADQIHIVVRVIFLYAADQLVHADVRAQAGFRHIGSSLFDGR